MKSIPFMNLAEVTERIAEIERLPKHLREFEEQCALRSLRHRQNILQHVEAEKIVAAQKLAAADISNHPVVLHIRGCATCQSLKPCTALVAASLTVK